jgi:glycosyltransferase involved in cell wall biosynthesis
LRHSEPLVSIGMPVRDGEQFIRQALDSILAQTYTHLEVIVSDNASTDKTGAICRDYAARDQRIRYYRNEVNIGAIANFCRVYELSSGEYFMWAAADDVRPKTAVEDCLKALLGNKNAVMAHGPVLIKMNGREDLIERTNEVCLSDLSARKRISAFTKGIKHNGILYGLHKQDALAKCTLRDTYGHDYLLCLQMCLLGPFEYVRRPMIVYSERGLVPSDNPMYAEAPITLINLLIRGGPKKKCWVVLTLGCYYLLKIRGLTFCERVGGVAAHSYSFSVLYRSRLVKEIMFRLFSPAAWLSKICWSLASRWEFSWSLGQKLKAILLRN